MFPIVLVEDRTDRDMHGSKLYLIPKTSQKNSCENLLFHSDKICTLVIRYSAIVPMGSEVLAYCKDARDQTDQMAVRV